MNQNGREEKKRGVPYEKQVVLDAFPVTLKITRAEYHRNKANVSEHLREDYRNTVLITKYYVPEIVMMTAKAYLELIRE